MRINERSESKQNVRVNGELEALCASEKGGNLEMCSWTERAAYLGLILM